MKKIIIILFLLLSFNLIKAEQLSQNNPQIQVENNKVFHFENKKNDDNQRRRFGSRRRYQGGAILENKAEIDSIINKLETIHPISFKYIKENYDDFINNPEFKELLIKFYRFIDLRHRDNEKYDNMLELFIGEITMFTLGKMYQDSNITDKKLIESELIKIVKEVFDKKETFKKMMINELEKKIIHEKEVYESRQKNKEAIINKKINELKNNTNDLEW